MDEKELFHAIEKIVVDHYEIQAVGLSEDIAEAVMAVVSPPAEVTDDMVERAAKAAWEATMPSGFVAEPWDEADKADRDDARAQVRAALTAALGLPPAEVERERLAKLWEDWSLEWASRLTIAEAIIDRARECVREEYPRPQIMKVLDNPRRAYPSNPFRVPVSPESEGKK